MPANTTHHLALIGQQRGERGRATKYDPDTHCWTVRNLAQRGEFPEAWAAEIGITLNTMRVWVNTHEEFAEAVIIARHLLQTYWTRELAKARNDPNSKPGIYSIMVRRFPELYGKNPIDLFSWLQTKDAGLPDNTTTSTEPQPLSPDGVRRMSDEDIALRLEQLRRRRAEESEGL